MGPGVSLSSAEVSDNLVFMNNKGGDCTWCGEWTLCRGNSQSFATQNGRGAADKPQQFTGHLPDDVEVSFRTHVPCGPECGFTRPVAMKGGRGRTRCSSLRCRCTMTALRIFPLSGS